jgi:hypothetical protein
MHTGHGEVHIISLKDHPAVAGTIARDHAAIDPMGGLIDARPEVTAISARKHCTQGAAESCH